MEDKQVGKPINVAVFVDYENIYRSLLNSKTNVLRLAFFEKLRKWCAEHPGYHDDAAEFDHRRHTR